MFISDVIASIAAGDLDYSDANRRKVLGSLRRCAAIYDTPDEHIPADVALFEARWGRGKVKTYPLTHFAGAEPFRDWRSNVRGAIAQATGARAAAADRRAREDGWTELLTAFSAVASPRKGKLFHPRLRIGLARIADYARRESLEPSQITTSVLVRLRDTHAITPNQKSSIRRAARTFDRLHSLPTVTHLLPAAPVSPLPQRRRGAARRAGLPASFLAEFTSWRTAYQRGTPTPLTGSVDPKSDGYMEDFDSALFWYVDTVVDLGLVTRSSLSGVRDLARPDWVVAAARSVLEAYDEDGEPEDLNVPPRLSLRSLQGYLIRLRTLFNDLDCAIAAKALTEMLEDRIFAALVGMTPDNIAFCKAVIASPSRQATFFQLPWTLKDKAQALLDRWEQLTPSERQAAIRAGACAVALLILIRVAPIRIGNLAAIPFRGKKRWLSGPSAGRMAELLIPARHVKNGKEIRATLQNAGSRDSWALVQWYLDAIRPRMVEEPRGHLKFVDGDALFPGQGGAITTATLRTWMMIETAAAGFPMRPHQARHTIASILINRHPEKIALIAALLGDTVATVEKTYAWLDREKLIADAQGLVPTAATILREARRG